MDNLAINNLTLGTLYGKVNKSPYINTQNSTPTKINHNQKPQQDTFETKIERYQDKKKKQKIANMIFIAILAAGVGFIEWGSLFKRHVNIAEHVEFIKAKTLKEARNFAKSNFGIDISDVDELQVANWINSSITRFSNILKGKIEVPEKILYRNLDENTLAEIYCESRELTINRKAIEKVDDGIFENIKLLDEQSVIMKNKHTNKFEIPQYYKEKYPEIYELLNKFIDSPETLDISEKLDLQNACTGILRNYINAYNLAYEKMQEVAQKYLSKNPYIDKKIFQHNIFTEFLKTDYAQENFITELCSGATTIFHELAHLLHFKNFKNKNDYYALKHFKNPEENSVKVKAFLADKKAQETAQKISSYAASSPLEFVAELFPRIVEKMKIPKDVLELNLKYNGLTLPNN